MGYVNSFDLSVDDPMFLQYINVKFDDADIGRAFSRVQAVQRQLKEYLKNSV